ncbi:MAG: transcription elongation factor GreA [Candidatus Brocadiia bacterium]
MNKKTPITADGLKKLKEKLSSLTSEIRPAVEKRLGEARELGDLSENSEFISAREELWRVDNQISELQSKITNAEIVSARNVNQDEVAFGACVKVNDLDANIIEEYILVGDGESNPAENLIAITTPIGQGLMGHKIGEIVKIKVPAGVLKYQIIGIKYNQ